MKAAILKVPPSEVTMVSFYCLFGTIQCGMVALVAEADWNTYKLKSSIEIILVLYSVSMGKMFQMPYFTFYCSSLLEHVLDYLNSFSHVLPNN